MTRTEWVLRLIWKRDDINKQDAFGAVFFSPPSKRNNANSINSQTRNASSVVRLHVTPARYDHDELCSTGRDRKPRVFHAAVLEETKAAPGRLRSSGNAGVTLLKHTDGR